MTVEGEEEGLLTWLGGVGECFAFHHLLQLQPLPAAKRMLQVPLLQTGWVVDDSKGIQ